MAQDTKIEVPKSVSLDALTPAEKALTYTVAILGKQLLSPQQAQNFVDTLDQFGATVLTAKGKGSDQVIDLVRLFVNPPKTPQSSDDPERPQNPQTQVT